MKLDKMNNEQALASAWTFCAPNRVGDFPRGFWPDVARVAVAMMEQQSTTPKLDFVPTRCERGSFPEPKVMRKSALGIDLGKLEITI